MHCKDISIIIFHENQLTHFYSKMKGILNLNVNQINIYKYFHFNLEGTLSNRLLILSDLSKWRTITQHYNFKNMITANCPSLQQVKQLSSPCSSPDECLCTIPSLVAYMLCTQGMFSCEWVDSSTMLICSQNASHGNNRLL